MINTIGAISFQNPFVQSQGKMFQRRGFTQLDKGDYDTNFSYGIVINFKFNLRCSLYKNQLSYSKQTFSESDRYFRVLSSDGLTMRHSLCACLPKWAGRPGPSCAHPPEASPAFPVPKIPPPTGKLPKHQTDRNPAEHHSQAHTRPRTF